MARSPSRGDLFINIGGDVTPLRNAVKAGKSVLNEFGSAAIDIQQEVDKAFANMGSNAPAEAKRIEQSFARSFAEIRRNAQNVLKAGNSGGAVQILDAAAARDGAAAAEQAARELRELANAAILADKAANGTNGGVRVLAVTTETAAREAQQYAVAMRDQANALDLVEAQLLQGSGAQQRFAQQQQRTTAITGQSRAGMQQLGFQLNDIAVQFAAGTPPAIIFSQQIGQVTQAVQLMNDGTSKAAAFLGGPWGIAIGVAVSVLVPLIAKIMEGTDEVGKLVDKKKEDARQSYLNAEADRVWKTTIEGVTEAIKKRREEQERERKSEPTVVQENIAGSKSELQNALTGQKETLKDIAILEKQILDYRRATGQPTGSQYAEARLKALRETLSKFEQQIKTAQTAIRAAERTAIERSIDPATKSVDQLEIELDQLQATFDAGGISKGVYAKRFQELSKAITAAKDATKGAGKAVGEFGKQISFDEAAAIARGAGFTVNSAQRSTERQRQLFNDPKVNRPGNPVAVPGTSAHEGANGKWALDIQITADVTPDKIKKVFASQGVKLTKVFKENGHYHIEGSRTDAARAENAIAKAADLRQDQDDNYASKRQALDDREFEVRNALIKGVDEQVRVQKEQVDRALDRYRLAIQNDVNDKRLRDEQGKELIATAEAVAIKEKANIDARAREEATAKALDDLDAQLSQAAQFAIDDKQFQEDQARTNDEKLALQNEIIDLIYEERKRHLEYLKHQAELNGQMAEAALIQGQINNLPREKARDQTRAANDNRSPLDAYFNGLPQSLAEVNEELEKMAANRLNQLGDQLGAATAKALGLKGALGDVVGELIKLAFQMAISAAFGGGSFNLGSLFGGGRARGGPVNDNQWYIVGENGPEIFVPGSSGTIIPNHVIDSARMPQIPPSFSGRASNSGRGRGGDTYNSYMTVKTPDVGGFKRNERQMQRDQRRRFGLGNK